MSAHKSIVAEKWIFYNKQKVSLYGFKLIKNPDTNRLLDPLLGPRKRLQSLIESILAMYFCYRFDFFNGTRVKNGDCDSYDT